MCTTHDRLRVGGQPPTGSRVALSLNSCFLFFAFGYNSGMTFSRVLVHALNRQTRPERRNALRAFAGRVVVLRVGPARVALRVCEDGKFSSVHSAVHADAEMEVGGEFLRGDSLGRKAKTKVSGDAEFLRVVGEALQGAMMDLEGAPFAAPFVLGGRAVVRAVEVWGPRAGKALVENRTLAAPEAVSQFNRNVDNVLRGVSRMESAVAAMRHNAKGKTSQ